MKNLNKLQELTFNFDNISSIEHIGMKECIDIEVEEDCSFSLSNGIISHNSACGSLASVIGRDGYGYIQLKGIPLSSFSKSTLDVLKNHEMKLTIDVLGLELDNQKLETSNNWYEIELHNGQKILANENDEVLLDNYFYTVKDLLDEI